MDKGTPHKSPKGTQPVKNYPSFLATLLPSLAKAGCRSVALCLAPPFRVVCLFLVRILKSAKCEKPLTGQHAALRLRWAYSPIIGRNMEGKSVSLDSDFLK